MASNHHTGLFLAVLLTATSVAAAGEVNKDPPWWWPWQPVSVYVTNNLEGHGNLQVHYKDKSEDFGVHQIPYSQTYMMKVYPWVLSDYYCGFVFDNVLHWFDIYKEQRDWLIGCGTKCEWSIYKAGPCLAKPHGCYQWNRNGPIY